MSEFDAVVIGSGFAGSWAAKELTESGVSTLMLEAGPIPAARDIPERFPAMATSATSAVSADSARSARNLDGAVPGLTVDPARQHIQSQHSGHRSRGPHFFVDDIEHPYETPPERPYYWIRGMQVGGRSLTWGGTALRLSAKELAAWPVSYEELAPWYARVEELMGVCGDAEGLARLPDSVYRHEPHALTPAEKDFQEAYRPAGTRPIAVRFIPAEGGRDGWPAFTMQGTALAQARRTNRLSLRANVVATEVTVDPDTGHATGVRYVDTADGSRHHVRSRVVFLCCGTIETARLMLNSRLGTSSGWLGRGLMEHPVVCASGVLDSYPPAAGYEWSARQRGLMVPPRPDDSFGLWVTLQRLTRNGQPVGNIDAQGEMLPAWYNRVRLSKTKDKWGVPIPVIECGYGTSEERLYSAMREAISQAAAAAGLRITSISDSLLAPGLNVHDLGTARMGSNPEDSVLDAENRCWDCPNVFVTDGACFPTGGWQNPTLTIMAISARAGRRAAEFLRSSS